MITTGGTMGIAEWIVDGTLVLVLPSINREQPDLLANNVNTASHIKIIFTFESNYQY